MFYWFVKNFFKVIFLLYNRAEVHGLEEGPPKGACIIAANHASHLDPPLVGAMYPGQLAFLAIDYLFRIPFIGFCIRHLGAFPVYQDSTASAMEVLKTSIGILKADKQMIIFPEGTRSFNGKLKEFEGGVAMLALKTGAPILPVFVKGTHRALPRGRRIPKPTKLSLHFGDLLHPEALSPDLSGKAKRQEILRELERRLRELGAE